MAIDKYYEIVCDYKKCGNASHYMGRGQAHAERQFIKEGGIVKGKKHYCDNDCYTKAMEK